MNRMKVTFVAVVLLLGWLPAVVDAAPILSAPFVTQNVGDTFVIAISVGGAVGLTSFQFDLGFDPTIVQMLSFTDAGTDFETAANSAGGFLTGEYQPLAVPGNIDTFDGLIPVCHRFGLGGRDRPLVRNSRCPNVAFRIEHGVRQPLSIAGHVDGKRVKTGRQSARFTIGFSGAGQIHLVDIAISAFV